jgi:actin-related protein
MYLDLFLSHSGRVPHTLSPRALGAARIRQVLNADACNRFAELKAQQEAEEARQIFEEQAEAERKRKYEENQLKQAKWKEEQAQLQKEEEERIAAEEAEVARKDEEARIEKARLAKIEAEEQAVRDAVRRRWHCRTPRSLRAARRAVLTRVTVGQAKKALQALENAHNLANKTFMKKNFKGAIDLYTKAIGNATVPHAASASRARWLHRKLSSYGERFSVLPQQCPAKI